MLEKIDEWGVLGYLEGLEKSLFLFGLKIVIYSFGLTIVIQTESSEELRKLHK